MQSVRQSGLELEWVKRAFHDGRHNAVTSLAHWRGRTWLAFRSAEGHDPITPGVIRLLVSDDLENWQLAGNMSSGMDDRDPKLVATADRLWIFFGATQQSLTQDGLRDRSIPRLHVTHQASTADGVNWSLPAKAYTAGWWIWSPRRGPSGFWGLAYGLDAESPGPLEVHLVHSKDGCHWQHQRDLLEPGAGNEGDLMERPDGSLFALIRGTGDSTYAFESDAQRKVWRRVELDSWCHAPALCAVGTRLFVGGRARLPGGGYRTRIFEWKQGQLIPQLDLPSGGDTSYCGMISDSNDSLLISYYSQHEFQSAPDFVMGAKPAAVYVARVKLKN